MDPAGMDFDPESLLTNASSDPMLGKQPDPVLGMAGPSGTQQVTAAPPSGSFIVLKNTAQLGAPGKVTQLGNINVTSLTPGQVPRSAPASKLTAFMGRPAGSSPGSLAKFIQVSQQPQVQVGGQQPIRATAAPGQPIRLVAGTGGPVRLLAAGQQQYRMVAPAGSPTKTITLTSVQAQQIGLISPAKKVMGYDANRHGSASPQRILIRTSQGLVPANKALGVSTAQAGSTLRLMPQPGVLQQSVAGKQQGMQVVRVVGSAATPTLQPQTAFLPAGTQQQQALPLQQTAGASVLPHVLPPTVTAAPGSNTLKIAIAPSSQPSQRLLLPAGELPRSSPVGGQYVLPSDPPELVDHLPMRGRPARPQVTAPGPPKPARSKQQHSGARSGGSGGGRSGGAARAGPPLAPGDTVPAIRPRKPCNCTKSQCLKLYCDCFAAGEFCNNCNCSNCFNSLDHEEDRQRAIRSCLDRNPHAFKPKIGKSDNETRKHQKGCNCKKSGCLKNYCECYEAKIFCSSQCKCVGCKNSQSGPVRTPRPIAAGSLEDGLTMVPLDGVGLGPNPTRREGGLKVATFPVLDKPPMVRVTQDVIDATLMCLMEAACEPGDVERRVLTEFGRCLTQIIEYGCKQGEGMVLGL